MAAVVAALVLCGAAPVSPAGTGRGAVAGADEMRVAAAARARSGAPRVLRVRRLQLRRGWVKADVFEAGRAGGSSAQTAPLVLRFAGPDGRGGRARLVGCTPAGDTCRGPRSRVRPATEDGVAGWRLTVAVPVSPDGARPGLPSGPVVAALRRGGDRAPTLSVLGRCRERGRAGVDCRAGPAPNVILVITDDQRWDTLEYLPTVRGELGAAGVTFSNAFVTTPVCCPSRASILSGLYAHNHGTLTLGPPDGGAQAFVGADRSTLATWLQAAGYRTGHFGKYLNGYHRLGPPARPRWYVPPGWTRWRAFREPGYFDYELVGEDRTLRRYGDAEEDYSTDVLARAVEEFVGEALDAGEPYFVHFTPFAPHVVSVRSIFAQPAPRHAELFADLPPQRPPAFDEEDVADKPSGVRRARRLTPIRTAVIDANRVRALQSLRAVDEAVGAFLRLVRTRGGPRDTIVVFTSDNGFIRGEHRLLLAKLCPYDECIRVPLVVRDPRLPAAARLEPALVANVDLAPTLAALAGVLPATPVDGRSVAPVLAGVRLPGRPPLPRADVLLEAWALDPRGRGGFVGVRTPRWKYVEYRPRRGEPPEDELYDLEHDPHELESVAGVPAHGAIRATLRARAHRLAAATPEAR